MHEMGIALEVIRIAGQSIPPELEGAQIAKINLKVGKLAAVVADSLRFCFEVASKGTPAEGARLVIEEIPVQLRCRGCGRTWTAQEPVFVCQDCRSTEVKMISGRELDIDTIELVDGENDDEPSG